MDIPAGARVDVHGSRPFELQATGNLILAGTINASGTTATASAAGPNAGGPGGGAGGQDGTQAGFGPGGGGHGTTITDGGGGGGFGGAGAAGGADTGTAGARGAAYGNLDVALRGGSGGGGASGNNGSVGGGGGGGAVELRAASLTITPTGTVLVEGGSGSAGANGASGGGSGGGIILHAGTLHVSGTLNANGGQGGAGGCCGDGGGGGGGRISYQYRTLTSAGNVSVTGGTSGTNGPGGHGNLSPQARGSAGVVTKVVTKVQAPAATTGAATSISSAGATLTGTVNANGNATTYHFEYGTTTAYGASIPVPSASIGSDTANHIVSVVLSGLAPGTTYHYRIVATNQAGFTTAGSDRTFTTLGSAVARLTVTTGAARHVGTRSATLRGTVLSGGASVRYRFEYGTTTRFGHSTAVKTLRGANHAVSVSTRLTRLRPGATYRYRLVAVSGTTTVRGRSRTFSTHARVTLRGLSRTMSLSKSGLLVRIHVTSHARVMRVTATLNHRHLASSRRSSLKLRITHLNRGVHRLRITVRTTAGITTRTFRFAVTRRSPAFTG